MTDNFETDRYRMAEVINVINEKTSSIRSLDDFHSSCWDVLRDAEENGNFYLQPGVSLLMTITGAQLDPEGNQDPFENNWNLCEDIGDLPDYVLENLLDYVCEINNDHVKGRLYDVFWSYKKPKSVEHAIAAIDAYVKSDMSEEAWFCCSGEERWYRSLVLAMRLGKGAGQRSLDIASALMCALQNARAHPKNRSGANLYT